MHMLGKIILYAIAILALFGSISLRYSNPFEEKYDGSKYVTWGSSFRNQTIAEFGIRRFEIFRLTKNIEKMLKGGIYMIAKVRGLSNMMFIVT